MEAVVFDMDGVLFDTERLCMETWREIAKERGIDNIEIAVQGCIGLNRTDTRQFFADNFGKDFPYEDFRITTAERMKKKLEKEVPMLPGVVELLDYLVEKNVKIGLASSSRKESVMSHLERSGLKKYFEVIITGDMIEHSKPLPDIYLMACKELNSQPCECYAIEDSINGIRSAYSAGMKAVMVPDMVPPTPEMEEKCTVILPSLIKVKEWFEQQ